MGLYSLSQVGVPISGCFLPIGACGMHPEHLNELNSMGNDRRVVPRPFRAMLTAYKQMVTSRGCRLDEAMQRLGCKATFSTVRGRKNLFP